MAPQLRSRLLSSALLVALLVLVSWSPAQAESRRSYGKSVIASLLEQPLVVDPVEARTHTDVTVISLLFDTLYRERAGEIEPHLASALPDATDPLHVRIAIRPGVLFHDGHTLSVADVASSLRRLQRSELGHLLASVKSVEPSDGALLLHLRAADEQLARRLSVPQTAITARGRRPNWRRLAGTGVFRLEELSGDRHELRLLAHERHFAGRSYIDELILRWYEDAASESRAYETGGTQISLRGDIAFAGHRPKYKTQKQEGPAMVLAYLGFGKAQVIDSESRFRRALSLAIGRGGMRQIGSGEKIVPTLSVHADPRRRRRLSAWVLRAHKRAAGRLMAELARSNPALASGALSLELIVNKSRPDDAAIAGRVAAALFRYGIRTRIVELGAKSFATRVRAGQCDLYVGQLALSSALKGDQLRTAFIVGKQGKTVAALADHGASSIQKRFDAELPIVPLFHRAVRVHHRSDLQGLAFARTMRLMFEDLFFFGLPDKN